MSGELKMYVVFKIRLSWYSGFVCVNEEQFIVVVDYTD